MSDGSKTSWIPVLLIVVALSLIVHGLVTKNPSVDFDHAAIEIVDGDADKPERQYLLQVMADEGLSLAATRKDPVPAVLAFSASLLIAGAGIDMRDCLAKLGDDWTKKSVFVPGGSGAEPAAAVEAVCLGEDRIRHLLLGYRAANLGDRTEALRRFTWAQNSARLWGHGACEQLAVAAIERL